MDFLYKFKDYWNLVKCRINCIDLFSTRLVTADNQSRGFGFVNSYKVFYIEEDYLLFGNKKIKLDQEITFSYHDTILVRDELGIVIALKFYELNTINIDNELFTFYTSCQQN
jgi:hypothetical protein